MVNTRSAETLALDKTQQKKVVKETKKVKKQLEEGTLTVKESRKDAKIQAEEGRGVIYIGHIPHGFYEDEMRDYFKQFGKVTNVKVCRSRKTGNSKGYGYIEFDNPEIAKIAADTMNNYLMFKKRIVTEYVPYEKRPKHLFHGKSSSSTHTSVKSRRGKEKHSKNRTLDKKTLNKKNKNTLKRLSKKIKKLRDLGIQCKVSPIALETVDLKPVEKFEGMSLRGKRSEKLLIQQFEAPKELLEKDSEQEFRMPALSKSGRSKNPSQKSLTNSKSNKAILTKSLDSVKALLSRKTLTEQNDKESQTPPVLELKTERKVKKGGVNKAKKEKKEKLNLNSETVKKIARELIRKKGNPLVNVISSKKSPKKPTRKSKR